MRICRTLHNRHRAALLAVGAAFMACHAPPTEPPATGVTLAVHYSRTAPDAAAAAEAAAFTVELHALSFAPDGVGVLQAASVIASDRGAPFRGRSRAPVGTRWLDSAAVAAFVDTPSDAATHRRELLDRRRVVATAGLRTHLVAAPSSMPTLAFGGSHAPAIATLVTPADEHGPREELAIPADLAAEPHGLFAPGGGNGGLLLLVLPAGRADPGAVAAARARADEERRTAPHAAAPPPPWQVALTAVGEANRRPALLALLGPLQRPRAVDLVLAADERQLIAMTDALAGIDPTADDVGFRVERACWRTWLHRIERGELTPAMRAAATRQLGAVADDPATLALLLQTSADGTTFARHLRDENLLALDDRSAALRTTARDWLAACGVAVPDYDPLADRAARRRALRAFRQTTEAPR